MDTTAVTALDNHKIQSLEKEKKGESIQWNSTSSEPNQKGERKRENENKKAENWITKLKP